MTRRRLVVGAALAAVAVLFVALMIVPVLFGAGQFLYGGNGAGGNGGCVDVSEASAQPAGTDDARVIPANYLDLYRKAGKDYGIPWNVLAGIGKVETGHGTSRLPGVASGVNYAGAGGPMQFLAATFRSFAVDGNKDGKKDLYDPADAIPSAARYLKHNGAPQRMRTAIFMYNHSWDYVDLVLDWAKRYGGGDFKAVQSNGVDCADGQLPANASALVQRIISFALSQRGKPYVFGANGPDAWDCSSLLQGAFRSVGLSIPRTTFEQWPMGLKVPKGKEMPGDFVFFDSGPGSSSNNPGHVGMVIAKNKMIVARCTLCVPAITVTPYNRGDWIGVTRPLASKQLQPQLAKLGGTG
ncbi:C40 family peptidase [Actinomadura parmotrematis]|uniref:Bifunctional lytic transglycosylase/C40 family peptidase n=1 Tax=Actinomadura parmotrematis TaxID=2864039 RepID=A0ABS7FM79_9ACTN|nr:lytic murein transglycosylase [Actinomadura parmotrematis]MBW8481492.1 bifunctional lytic transglycosylase/C40 family peptidase [Actinomadura parmotrematis]